MCSRNARFFRSLLKPDCWPLLFFPQLGETTCARIRQEFDRRIDAGEFRKVSHVGAGKQYTTTAMVRMEREIVSWMQEGNRRDYSDPMLVSPPMRIATEDRHPEVNA